MERRCTPVKHVANLNPAPTVLRLRAFTITRSITEQSTERAHRDAGPVAGEMDVEQPVLCSEPKPGHLQTIIILGALPQVQSDCLLHQH